MRGVRQNEVKHAEDHFSKIAHQYARGRFAYPSGLYDFLATKCAGHNLAWDCATGTGQAAIALTKVFTKVIATDISKELIGFASPHPQICYRIAPSENSEIEPESVDLITVAQALHWFNLDEFWVEVRRVLKDGGVLAFWGYNWPIVHPAVDHLLEHYKLELALFWPKRSAILHEGYKSVCPPFDEIISPSFDVYAEWNRDDYLAHLSSWSATRYYCERTGGDIMTKFQDRFAVAWRGDRLHVKWPLVVRLFRKHEPKS